MAIVVMKFGETSAGSAAAIRQAAGIIQSQAGQWQGLVIVASALQGVTEALLRSARAAAAGDDETFQALIWDLEARHLETLLALQLDEMEEDPLSETIAAFMLELETHCQNIATRGELTPRGLDMLATFGERISAHLLAAVLRQRGLLSQVVDATELIVTDATYQNAVPQMELTRQHTQACLLPLLSAGQVPVVTGAIGATADGIPTTLGRRGSDYTATILGDCLDAAEIWTWTEVDGALTADVRSRP